MGANQIKDLQKQCAPATADALARLEEWDERRFEVFEHLFHFTPSSSQARDPHALAKRYASCYAYGIDAR